MPRSRAATLSAVAAAVLADPDLFRASRGLDEAVGRLLSIRGIGAWTAHYIALRQLREPDAFPADDAARWRPWRAYAAQHLWASSRTTGEGE